MVYKWLMSPVSHSKKNDLNCLNTLNDRPSESLPTEGRHSKPWSPIMNAKKTFQNLSFALSALSLSVMLSGCGMQLIFREGTSTLPIVTTEGSVKVAASSNTTPSGVDYVSFHADPDIPGIPESQEDRLLYQWGFEIMAPAGSPFAPNLSSIDCYLPFTEGFQDQPQVFESTSIGIGSHPLCQNFVVSGNGQNPQISFAYGNALENGTYSFNGCVEVKDPNDTEDSVTVYTDCADADIDLENTTGVDPNANHVLSAEVAGTYFPDTQLYCFDASQSSSSSTQASSTFIYTWTFDIDEDGMADCKVESISALDNLSQQNVSEIPVGSGNCDPAIFDFNRQGIEPCIQYNGSTPPTITANVDFTDPTIENETSNTAIAIVTPSTGGGGALAANLQVVVRGHNSSQDVDVNISIENQPTIVVGPVEGNLDGTSINVGSIQNLDLSGFHEEAFTVSLGDSFSQAFCSIGDMPVATGTLDSAATSTVYIDCGCDNPNISLSQYNEAPIVSSQNAGTSYGIYTINQFQNIQNGGGQGDRLSATYVQQCALNFDGVISMAPIGSESNPFTGHYNGNGQLMENITINASGSDHIGLFGYAQEPALIENIRACGLSVEGRDQVAGILGEGEGEMWVLANAINNVDVKGRLNVATMIGKTTATGVTVQNPHQARMPQIRYNHVGYFEACPSVASNQIHGIRGVGGFAGNHAMNATLPAIHEATGRASITENQIDRLEVYGKYYVGGGVGSLNGNILDNSIDVDVYGTQKVGGLSGQTDDLTKRNYVLGNVKFRVTDTLLVYALRDLGGLSGFIHGPLNLRSENYISVDVDGSTSNIGGYGINHPDRIGTMLGWLEYPNMNDIGNLIDESNHYDESRDCIDCQSVDVNRGTALYGPVPLTEAFRTNVMDASAQNSNTWCIMNTPNGPRAVLKNVAESMPTTYPNLTCQ